MLRLFIPSNKNQYRAHLIRPPALILFALIIWMVNSLLPASAFAQNNDLTIENLLTLHNEERIQNNLIPLRVNSNLTRSAQAKAEAMLTADCWAHFCPDNKSPWDFFLENGYDYIYAGENLAEGFVSSERVLLAWMNSQSHRDNVLKPQFEEVGFGITQGTFQGKPNNTIVVVHFGAAMDISVSQALNPSINILEPQNGATLMFEPVQIVGQSEAVSNINLFVNEEERGSIIPEGGVFTTRIRGLNEGGNKVILIGDANATAEVEFFYQPSVAVTSGIDLNLSNTLSLLLVTFIAALLLIDFVYISKHKVVSQKITPAHYHFALLILLSFVIVTGVGSGQIDIAIFI